MDWTRFFAFCWIGCLSLSCIAAGTTPKTTLEGRTTIEQWDVLGAFPSGRLDTPREGGGEHAGFALDFLVDAGGEAAVAGRGVLPERIRVGDSTLQTERVTAANGVLDLNRHFEGADWCVAYAACTIVSGRPQRAWLSLGSDDGVKVWVNGELVHARDVARGLTRGSDEFAVDLRGGENTVLCKVTEWHAGWALSVEVLEQDARERQLTQRRERAALLEFQRCALRPEIGNPWDGMFAGGAFPEIAWDRPGVVEMTVGELPLTVRWFDADLNEVERASEPGRYLWYAEGVTPGGLTVRRAGTIFCKPRWWTVWSERPMADLEFLRGSGFSAAEVNARRDDIARFVGRTTVLSALRQEEGALLLAYLHDISNGLDDPIATPMIRDADVHLALKRRLLGVEDAYPGLAPIRQRAGSPAPELRQGTEADAGLALGTVQRLHEICEAWYEQSGTPFVTLVARDGVIVLHRAYGDDPDRAVALDTPMPMASITKALTGLLFAQFVDQGLIEIDDPVGKYLPGFPAEGPKAITLRHCFTHTTGLEGHADWGGAHNPWLDSVIATSVDHLPVGEVLIYNGMGYDLAGKVMEVVSGKSVFRLFRERMFDPLGCDDTHLEEDLAFGASCTARDAAVIGQLMLNKGSYGSLELFAPGVMDRLMPEPLNRRYPGIEQDWGIGLTWMTQRHPGVGTGDVPAGATILSPRMFGHGAATSAVLRVDPDNRLVIAQVRRTNGRHYDEYLSRFLSALHEGLETP